MHLPLCIGVVAKNGRLGKLLPYSLLTATSLNWYVVLGDKRLTVQSEAGARKEILSSSEELTTEYCMM